MSERPIGVFILSILMIIGGVFLAPVMIMVMFTPQDVVDSIEVIGVNMMLVAFAGMFIALLSITAGVGMILGTRWGWYLGTFYYVYSIARSLSALVTLAFLPLGELVQEASSQNQYVKFSVRALISFLILLYLLRPSVKESLDAGDESTGRALLIMVGICVGITLLGTGLNYFVVSN